MKDIVRKILIVIDFVPDSDSGMSTAGLSRVCVDIDKIGCGRCGIQPCREEQGKGAKKGKKSQS